MSQKFLDQSGLSILWNRITDKFNNLSLRRDNDYNYLSTFIPKDGEVCFVDTSRDGLRVKVGDGVTQFGSLQYLDEQNNIIIIGYFYNNQFYYDLEHANVMIGSTKKIYVDKQTSVLYLYNGTEYIEVTQSIPVANSSQAGILKLYSVPGENEDGTMTQKAITELLNEKVGISLDETTNEVLIFTTVN